MLESCPPWVLLLAGFAVGAFPDRLQTAWSRYRSRGRARDGEPAE